MHRVSLNYGAVGEEVKMALFIKLSHHRSMTHLTPHPELQPPPAQGPMDSFFHSPSPFKKYNNNNKVLMSTRAK